MPGERWVPAFEGLGERLNRDHNDYAAYSSIMDDIEEAREEYERLIAENARLREDLDIARAIGREHKGEAAQLREALRWYIDAAENDRGEMSADAQEIADDAATHARAALAANTTGGADQ